MLSLARYSPFDLMGSFFNDYESVERKHFPLVDIYEKENDFFIDAQLPGMKKEDIKIEIDNNRLILSGESCKENENEQDNYYRKEIVKGKFIRSFDLSRNIDTDKLEAKFEDGILKIRLPKCEEVKSKQISIN